MSKILIPVPRYGFDPTEVAIPWKIFTENRVEVVFTTPDGEKAATDSQMLTGDSLGIWKPILRARKDAVEAHAEMVAAAAFSQPLQYDDAQEKNFDAVFLPGGHHKRVREYLESTVLQSLVADFFVSKKPVGAVCHGVVLAARSTNTNTGKSVLYDYKTTALLKSQEMSAYAMTRLWLRDYYLTYPGNTVEDEVRSALREPKNFLRGPTPVLRDSPGHMDRGFVVQDRNYVSARWPGDIYSLATKLLGMLQ